MDYRLIISLCLILAKISATNAESREDYMMRRKTTLDEEKHMLTGGDLTLNDNEVKVNDYLMGLKEKEYESAYRQGAQFPPAIHFFYARPLIEASPVFQIIKKMPKGGVLHVHDVAMDDTRQFIKETTYDPDCYFCVDISGQLLFKYSSHPVKSQDCDWKSVNAARNASGDVKAFDEQLYKGLTMVVDDPGKAYPTSDAIWNKFLSIFQAKFGIVFYAKNFNKYYYDALENMYNDNVQYVEMRGPVMNVYELNGTEHDQMWVLGQYEQVTQQFVKDHPDFTGAKVILTSSRTMDVTAVKEQIKMAVKMRRRFPDFLAGYDLVAREDTGHSLLYYLDDLLSISQNNEDLPFFFHAAETDWYGVPTDINVVDALLLNTSRIGHGFGITKHPRAMQMARERDVPLEVNPVSNQVLGYVADLRVHPASSLMAHDFPLVISCDDPSIWGVKGVSYDYYEAFMGLGGKWADLKTLKKLAQNSLKYSAMSQKEKAAAFILWEKKWNAFITDVIQENNL